MKTLKDLLIIVTILSVMIGIIAAIYGIRQGNEKNRLEQNLYSKTVQWEDERGRLVTETTELRYTVRELRQISKKDSSNMSEAEKKLLAARSTIDALNIRLRKVESVNMIEVESKGKYVTDYSIKEKDTIYLLEIKPIETKHLDMKFDVRKDSIIVNHTYRNSIDVIIDRDQELGKRGNKRFFLIRWIMPKWEYSSNVVSEDPNAEITSNVYFNFQKRKGKR